MYVKTLVLHCEQGQAGFIGETTTNAVSSSMAGVCLPGSFWATSMVSRIDNGHSDYQRFANQDYM